MSKVAVVTGGTSGIGLCTVKALKKAGCTVYEISRREKGTADAIHISADVTSEEQIKKAIDSVISAEGHIDILINNAGKAIGMDTIQEGKLDDWEEMIDTNIKGLLYATRLISPIMVERKSGFIINISSIAGRHAYPKGNVYCATKAAARTLSESMVIDLNSTGVRVCNIDPGMVETEFSLVRFKGDEERAANVYKSFTPLTADDIADIALFAATRPSHVMIQDIMVTPTAQASAYIVDKK